MGGGAGATRRYCARLMPRAVFSFALYAQRRVCAVGMYCAPLRAFRVCSHIFVRRVCHPPHFPFFSFHQHLEFLTDVTDQLLRSQMDTSYAQRRADQMRRQREEWVTRRVSATRYLRACVCVCVCGVFRA